MTDATSLRLGRQFRLDRGLDTVLDDTGTQPRLPDQRRLLPPSDIQPHEGLDALLAPHNLEQLLNEALRPRLRDPGILMPGRFAEALRLARQALARQESSRTVDAARRRRRMRKALQVLDEQEALHDLLWTYRNALQQG